MEAMLRQHILYCESEHHTSPHWSQWARWFEWENRTGYYEAKTARRQRKMHSDIKLIITEFLQVQLLEIGSLSCRQ